MSEDIDIIVVLPGGIKHEETTGRWVSTELVDGFGAPGAKLRIITTGILAKKYPAAKVFAGGGFGFDIPEDTPRNRPTLAKILRDELLEHGITEDRLLLEHNSNTTYQNLQELERMNVISNFKKIAVVTNRYHIERLKTIIEVKFPHWEEHATLLLVAAEDVLIAHEEQRWKEHIDNAYGSDWMARRIEGETRGVEQIRAHTYKFR
jgi:hypothetical protein